MQSTDIQAFRCDPITGRATNSRILSDVVANVFPHAKVKDRANGRTLYEKIAWRLMNVDNLPLLDPEHWMDSGSETAGEIIVKCLCGPRDNKAALPALMAGADLVGECRISKAVLAADTSIEVTVKHADLLPSGPIEILRSGMALRISSRESAIIEDGVEKDVTSTGSLTVDGLKVTIPLTEAVGSDFAIGDRVSGLLSPTGDVQTSFTLAKTSAAGTYDEAKLKLDNIGGVEEDFTITKLAGDAFEVVGDTLGSLPNGDTTANYLPINPASSRPYLTLEAGFFTGTWATGDTINLTTHQASLYIAEQQVIVQNAPAFQAAETAIVIAGEVTS